MRRLALALALSCAAAGAVPALATDAVVLPADQKVVGSVAAPVALVARVPRTLALTNRSTNGLTGVVFDVDAATVGGPFSLTTTDATGLGDLQIGFYSNLGTVDAPGAVAGEFLTEQAGGEKGFVPEGAKFALVYLRVGAQVPFAYAATPPIGLALSSASLDVTVPKGQALRWTNDTPGVLSVVADSEDDFPLFDSGELEPGASFAQAFPDAGTFPYSVGGRSGTVTVTG